jgi:hypothetical protein
MLWVYAENDHFFGPAIAERLRDAFVSPGGQVSFIKAAPFGQDGHLLFSQAGAAIWEPMVDDFLRSHGLAPAMGLLSSPRLPAVALPAGLRKNGQDAFRLYLASAPHKAFAIGASGAFGWRTARRSDEEAVSGALALCPGQGKSNCHVVMVNDQAVIK